MKTETGVSVVHVSETKYKIFVFKCPGYVTLSRLYIVTNVTCNMEGKNTQYNLYVSVYNCCNFQKLAVKLEVELFFY